MNFGPELHIMPDGKKLRVTVYITTWEQDSEGKWQISIARRKHKIMSVDLPDDIISVYVDVEEMEAEER